MFQGSVREAKDGRRRGGREKIGEKERENLCKMIKYFHYVPLKTSLTFFSVVNF